MTKKCDILHCSIIILHSIIIHAHMLRKLSNNIPSLTLCIRYTIVDKILWGWTGYHVYKFPYHCAGVPNPAPSFQSGFSMLQRFSLLLIILDRGWIVYMCVCMCVCVVGGVGARTRWTTIYIKYVCVCVCACACVWWGGGLEQGGQQSTLSVCVCVCVHACLHLCVCAYAHCMLVAVLSQKVR